MQGNIELLNFIYQNSEMGVDTLKQLIDIVEDEKFKNELRSELEEYQEIQSEAKRIIEKNDEHKKGISKLDKLETYIAINMKTLKDKSNTHIAEMLIVGSNMGVCNAIKNIRKYKGEVDDDIICLMDRLLDTEENNIVELKKYL